MRLDETVRRLLVRTGLNEYKLAVKLVTGSEPVPVQLVLLCDSSARVTCASSVYESRVQVRESRTQYPSHAAGE